MKNKQIINIGVILLAVAAVVATGCFSQKRAGSAKFSGFLGQDYDKLQKDVSPNRALYSWQKPGADIKAYDKMLLMPITVLVPAGENVTEDMQKVANNFYSQLVKEMSRQWVMVTEPAPGTLRARIALTDINPGSGPMQAVTSVVPVGIAVSEVKNMAGAKPSWAGEVSVEGRVTDAMTDELLGLGVDRRIAGKSIATSVNTWGALSDVTETWSKQFAYRLCSQKGRTDCEKP